MLGNHGAGRETIVYESPQAAEAAFYDAFQRTDLDAMMAVWADDDDVVCVHPMGARLQGREAIRASWRDIFSGGGAMRFNITDAQYTQDDAVSVHFVHENISFGEGFGQTSLVIATNVYRLTETGWRMCAHHGSPGRRRATVAAAAEPETMH